MSGAIQNITGFGVPTSIGGFLSLLQHAAFRGVPFSVIGAEVRKGRKGATHNYPFRDGAMREDMGRAARIYAFTGYLIGDLAPAMQLLLDNALETQGPGLLLHPTLGAVQVSLLSAATSVSRDAMRVISIRMEFMEQEPQSVVSMVISTALSVLAAASTAITGLGASLGGVAGPAADPGGSPVLEGVTVASAFVDSCIGSAGDTTALTSMAAGLPPPDNYTEYGRYAAGNATVGLGSAVTVQTLQTQIALQRAAVAAAGANVVSVCGTLSSSTGGAVTAALSTLTEAVRLTMTDPGDQVRVLLLLATFSYADSFVLDYIGARMAVVRNAVAAACRRVALMSLANASAAYQPLSYQDAYTVRSEIAAALDVEILAAGDAGDDDAYDALRNVRVLIIQDLTTRGATLPQVETVSFGASLPSLVIAQMLYKDATRSDQITNEAMAPHPAFCPSTFQALAS
jgi:prophage DNA circulation protein